MINLLFVLVILVLVNCGNVVAPVNTDNNPDDSIPNPITISESGRPFNIALKSVSNNKITVKGVAGVERATILFSVTDSAGKFAKSGSEIVFVLACGDSVATLLEGSSKVQSGLVECTILSGVASGSVSLTALYYERLGEPLALSECVPVIVSGGAPVQDKFTIILNRNNIPAIEGERVGITIFVADKYGNPSSGRSVFISTTQGLIPSGALSDSVGTIVSTLTLYSPWSVNRSGSVRAKTYDGSGNVLVASADFLISGKPVINFTHNADGDTFNLVAASETRINYTVADSHGNPLSKDTKISAELSGGGIIVGSNETILPDVLSGYTSYSSVVRDDGSGSRIVYFKVSVVSANGNETKGLWGKVR